MLKSHIIDMPVMQKSRDSQNINLVRDKNAPPLFMNLRRLLPSAHHKVPFILLTKGTDSTQKVFYALKMRSPDSVGAKKRVLVFSGL